MTRYGEDSGNFKGCSCMNNKNIFL